MFDFIKKSKPPTGAEAIIEQMKMMAQALEESGDYERAFGMYKQIVELSEDSDAFYSLGVMYAMGRGVEQSFLNAAYNFSKARTPGDDDAEKLLLKAKTDYINQLLNERDEQGVYSAMVRYAELLEADTIAKLSANKNLLEYGNYLYNKGEFQKAAKVYRAGAVYGDEATCQYNLAAIYCRAELGERNIPAGLYWLEKALTGGIEDAKDAIHKIMSFCQNNGMNLIRILDEIIISCIEGSDDIPRDSLRVEFWTGLKKSLLSSGE